jgi:hypothetical protein
LLKKKGIDGEKVTLPHIACQDGDAQKFPSGNYIFAFPFWLYPITRGKEMPTVDSGQWKL